MFRVGPWDAVVDAGIGLRCERMQSVVVLVGTSKGSASYIRACELLLSGFQAGTKALLPQQPTRGANRWGNACPALCWKGCGAEVSVGPIQTRMGRSSVSNSMSKSGLQRQVELQVGRNECVPGSHAGPGTFPNGDRTLEDPLFATTRWRRNQWCEQPCPGASDGRHTWALCGIPRVPPRDLHW